MFDIEKIISKGDYNYCVVRGHPNANEHGYVLHHRVVMENSINRLLTKSEVVHHKDENKKNNDLSNLELMERSEHNRLHASTGRAMVELVCPNCGVVFIKPKNQLSNKQQPKCSRKCNGQYSRKLQLGLIDKHP